MRLTLFISSLILLIISCQKDTVLYDFITYEIDAYPAGFSFYIIDNKGNILHDNISGRKYWTKIPAVTGDPYFILAVSDSLQAHITTTIYFGDRMIDTDNLYGDFPVVMSRGEIPKF